MLRTGAVAARRAIVLLGLLGRSNSERSGLHMVRRLAHQSGDHCMAGRNTGDRRRDAGGLGERFDVGDLDRKSVV